MTSPSSNAPHTLQQNILLAAGFSFLNAGLLSGMTMFAKLLSQYFGPIEITFFRNLASLFFLLIIFIALKKMGSLWRTQRPKAHLIRSFIGTCGIITGMWSFSLSPLVVATLLFFTAPLFVVILSPLILKEKIGPMRVMGVIFGFIGVGIVSYPAFTGQASDFTILGVIVGIMYGFIAGGVDLTLRWMGNTEDASTTTFYFLLFGLIATAFYWPFSDTSPLQQSAPSIFIIAGLGLTGVLSLLAKSQSYRLGDAAVVAPITYTMVIWAGLFDYFIWDHLPSIELLIGSGLIIGSNLFILWREHKAKTRDHISNDPPPPPARPA